MTMSPIVYNIPLALIEAYRGRPVIIRSNSSSELIGVLGKDDLENILYVRLLSLSADVDALADWGVGVAVDLTMSDPDKEFATLYNFAKLLDKHPVRVSIPVIPGFSKAVKVAASLNFAVKLSVGQPAQDVIEELYEVLQFFLHQPAVSQPVEFFQSTLQTFLNQDAATLWAIQEEDPARFRYVTDDGVETIAPRFAGAQITGDPGSFVGEFKTALLAEHAECEGCAFLEHCQGFFKWPRRDYSCDGVKTILGALQEAADELKKDLSAFDGLKRKG